MAKPSGSAPIPEQGVKFGGGSATGALDCAPDKNSHQGNAGAAGAGAGEAALGIKSNNHQGVADGAAAACAEVTATVDNINCAANNTRAANARNNEKPTYFDLFLSVEYINEPLLFLFLNIAYI